MKKLWLWCVILLSGCGQNIDSISDESAVLAQVGDIRITENLLLVAMKSRGLQSPNEEQKKQVFDQLVTEVAMAYQAKQKKLSLSDEQMAMLFYQQLKAQGQAAVNDHLIEKPITEEQVKAEYEKVVAETKGLSFHVRHLLFKDEVNAVGVLDRIQAGEVTYAEAEAQYLRDRPRVRNVGDIGWVNLKQLPEAFHRPLQTMSQEQVFPKVIVSQFGAHVLYLAGKQSTQPPTLETAEAGIRQSLRKQAIERFTQLAQAKAKVKMAQ